MITFDTDISEDKEFKRLQGFLSSGSSRLGWIYCSSQRLVEAMSEEIRRKMLAVNHRVKALYVLDGTRNIETYSKFISHTGRRDSLLVLNAEESLRRLYLNPNRPSSAPKYEFANSLNEYYDFLYYFSVPIVFIGTVDPEELKILAPACYRAVYPRYSFLFSADEKDGKLTLKSSSSKSKCYCGFC